MTTTHTRLIYVVGARPPDAGLTREVVGGKAANLARLDALGLTVPPALALPTALCRDFLARGVLPDGFRARLAAAIRHLERATGCTLGGSRPLLVSVRSSPPNSMPGMLRTVLNVGMTEDAVRGLVRRTGNPWFAWDVYRRFIRSFAETVSGVPPSRFEELASAHLARAGVDALQDLDALSLRELARACVAVMPSTLAVPTDPLDQIVAAIESVFRSWTAPWAGEYRRLNHIDDDTGTGVLIQAMVFGNSGARSGSGVGFTRNPATGVHELYVDFLFNAQGEDVVAGRLPVSDADSLPVILPDVWMQLTAAADALEREFADMQDFEFTVDEGRLFFLQTRAAKRTPWAAVRTAVDLVQDGLIDEAAALERLDAYDLNEVSRIVLKPGLDDPPIARATPASVGVASGAVVFDAARAQRLGRDQPVIFVSAELSTDDVAALASCAGVVTTFGGRTSHAAVVARQLGKVCLVGCSELRIDGPSACTIGARRFREGDILTIDGESGFIYAGAVPVVTERPERELSAIAAWRGRMALTMES
ncbi:MAG TPA: PEP/pyruvate-binding domain-containing protein [Rhodanobacteraceae bacterium]